MYNALGHRRGGFSTKLHAVVDTKARPIYVTVTAGQRHELYAAREVLAHARGKALIGDTGYDSNDYLQAVRERGKRPVIPAKPERTKPHRLVRALCRRRYQDEVIFHNLERSRANATRYEKTAGNDLALVQLARSWLWLSQLGSREGKLGARPKASGPAKVPPGEKPQQPSAAFPTAPLIRDTP